MSELTKEQGVGEVYLEPAIELNGTAVDPLASLECPPEEPNNNNICPSGGC